jgi:hypothetical protein
MSSAWVYQKPAHLAQRGAAKASWYVGSYEPDGRRKGKACGAGFRGRKLAEKLQRKLEGELTAGTYQKQARKAWEDFRGEYRERILAGLAVRTRLQADISLDHYERIAKPLRVSAVSQKHVDYFIAERRKEKGRKAGDALSPFSLNKDLRHIKAALRVAVEWRYLAELPKFRMEKAPKRLPTYVNGDHFALIYRACD